MNANELADELEAFHVDPDGFPYMIGEAINMLRQQQAKIEALKSVVYWLKENRPEVWDDIQKWRKL